MLGVVVSLRVHLLPCLEASPALVCIPLKLVSWRLSTRLETRTKESNACVSFWVVKLCCALKEIVGMFAPATNQAIV